MSLYNKCHCIFVDIAVSITKICTNSNMDKSTKRVRTLPTEVCQYGKNCYRKNPHHFMEYTHDHLDKIIDQNLANHSIEQYEIPKEMISQKDLILEQIKVMNELYPRPSCLKRTKYDQPTTSDTLKSTSISINNGIQCDQPSTSQRDSTSKDIHKYIKVVPKKGQMENKLAAARPYNYFLTCIPSSPATHDEPLSITFQELLDHSLGELENSVQINFMVEIGWLLGQYFFAGYINKPMLLLYGSGNLSDMDKIVAHKPRVTAHLIKMPTPFSTHHTKMISIFSSVIFNINIFIRIFFLSNTCYLHTLMVQCAWWFLLQTYMKMIGIIAHKAYGFLTSFMRCQKEVTLQMVRAPQNFVVSF